VQPKRFFGSEKQTNVFSFSSGKRVWVAVCLCLTNLYREAHHSPDCNPSFAPNLYAFATKAQQPKPLKALSPQWDWSELCVLPP
jgi:hypothetical protein